MSNILLASDIHIGAKKFSDDFLETSKEFFYKFIKDTIETNNIKHFFILGDLFDDRHIIDIKVKKESVEIFKFLTSTFQDLNIYILYGNHDIYYKNTLDVNSLNILDNISDRIFFIKQRTEFKIEKSKIIAYPWMWDGSDSHVQFKNDVAKFEATNIKEYDYAFGHFEIDGFEVIHGVKHEGGISQKDFNAFGEVYSGHFHIRQKLGNIQYLGCPYEITWGDSGDAKGVTIIDPIKKNSKFIKNNISKKHIKLYASEIEKDDSKLSSVSNNIVKIFIDKKLSDTERINLITKIENNSVSDLSIIDEIEGTTDDENSNIEIDEEIEGNEIKFMNEWLDNTKKDNPNINKIKLYCADLYLKCQKG